MSEPVAPTMVKIKLLLKRAVNGSLVFVKEGTSDARYLPNAPELFTLQTIEYDSKEWGKAGKAVDPNTEAALKLLGLKG